MKVLITAPSLDESRNVSGISTVVRQIIEFSDFTFSHFEAGRRDGNGNTGLWIFRQLLLPFRFLWRIRRFSPDVVHINTAMTGLAICRDSVLVEAARVMRRPVVLAIHGGEGLRETFRNGILENITRRMLRRAVRVVVLSDEECALLRIRWPRTDIDVLPNAVPISYVETRKKKSGPPVVVFLGRMHESKGLGEVIEACRILKNGPCDFTFRAYGEGPMRGYFESKMATILADSFEYCGVVSGTDKWKALATADIFVLPSAFEGLSMALLEAMAAGCVVVASDIPSISEVINDGENGYLVEPKNSDQLAGVLARLLTEPNKWKPISEKAVATIRDNFRFDEYIKKLENIYAEVVERNR